MRIQIPAILAVFVLLVGGVHGAAETFQRKSQEFAFGEHPVLQADVVEMDLRISKTRTREHDLSRNRSVAEVVGQDLAFNYRFFPEPWIELTNQFKLGFSKNHEIEEGYFEDETKDRWHQLQKAQVALKDEANRVQVKIYEQFRQDFYGDRDLTDRRLRLGGEADIQIARNLSLSPSWWQEEHWVPERNPAHREEFGARLKWDAMREVAITPEAAEQRVVLSNGEVRDKQRVGVGFLKQFPKAHLTLKATPGYEKHFVDVGHSANHRIHKIDSFIAWKPNEHWKLRTGGTLEHQEHYVREIDRTVETVYSEVNHHPLDDLTVRFRGDYRLTESHQEDRPDLGQSDSRMKLSLSPEVQLNENLFASARYIFEYYDQGQGVPDQQEQVLSFSLQSQF